MRHHFLRRAGLALAVVGLVVGIGAPDAGAVGPAGADGFNAAPLLPPGPGVYTGNNLTATAQAGEPAIDGNTPAASVWWKYRRRTPGTVQLTTRGANFDTVLAVYRGTSVQSLTLVRENDDANSNVLWSRVRFQAQANVTYRVKIDGYESPPVRRGRYVLRVTLP